MQENPASPSDRVQEAVRALKRRVADLEQQLAQQQAAGEAAAAQAQAGTAAEAGRAARAAAALQQCEQQLAEARQQSEEYGRRLAAVEGQLQKAEFAKAQWEWRAQVRLGVVSAAALARCGFGKRCCVNPADLPLGSLTLCHVCALVCCCCRTRSSGPLQPARPQRRPMPLRPAWWGGGRRRRQGGQRMWRHRPRLPHCRPW